jgi:hypothetical protein
MTKSQLKRFQKIQIHLKGYEIMHLPIDFSKEIIIPYSYFTIETNDEQIRHDEHVKAMKKDAKILRNAMIPFLMEGLKYYEGGFNAVVIRIL